MNMKSMHKYCFYYVFIKFYSNKFMQCYPCALCFYWKNIGHNLLFAKYDTLCTSPPACNCSTLFQYRTTLNLNDQFLSLCRTKLSKFIAATLERIEQGIAFSNEDQTCVGFLCCPPPFFLSFSCSFVMKLKLSLPILCWG